MSFAQALVRSVNFNPYKEDDVDEIRAIRANGNLCIDFYLQDLSEQFPPRTVDQLVTLIGDIESSDRLSTQEQAIIIYQIFLEYDSSDNSKGMAEYYAQELRIPVSWQNYARALHSLQKHRNAEAIELLGTFPAPKQIIDTFINSLASDSSPFLLPMFFDSHRHYLDHDNLETYIKALCEADLYYNVLEILRGYTLRQDDILEMLGNHAASLACGNTNPALTLGKSLSEFVAVPFSDEEWKVIQTHLDQLPSDSVASRVSLVRALSLGDLSEINKMKDVEPFKVLTSSYDDY